jgi:hypothetical protein
MKGYAWLNTKADGTGNSYAADCTFVMGTSDENLYAVWTQKPTYTVTFFGAGGTGTLKRKDYVFGGWTMGMNGDIVGTSFTMGSANIALYAWWDYMDPSPL